MKLILEFNEFKDNKSETRTKALSDEEFLKVFTENCSNFSFDNDQLWRKTDNVFGSFGIFFEAERDGTIGEYSYKDFFEERMSYLVPRYRSLIGSTTYEGAEAFGSYGNELFLVIPFNDSNIIFSGCPDLALWSNKGQIFTDDLFILKQYSQGFKVPTGKLRTIFKKSKASSFLSTVDSKNLGFEFFTNANCLLLDINKINWLKSKI